MKYKDEGMNFLHEELAKTGVISVDFKRLIELYANQAVQEAYERGRADERELHIKDSNKLDDGAIYIEGNYWTEN